MVERLLKARWMSIFKDNPAASEAALVALLTLTGAALRFYKLGEWSFWGDEVFTIGTKEDGFNSSIWMRSLATDLIHWVTAEFGVNEWNARVIPALIGILSIPILYYLARRAVQKPAAVAFATLLALSPWHLYWSQNARFYILLLLFYTCGYLAFYIGLEEDRPLWMIASLILFGMAARERLLAAFSFPILLTYVLLLKLPAFQKPRGLNWKNLLIFFGPTVLAGGILIAPILLNLRQWMEGFSRINSDPLWIVMSTSFYIGLPVVCLGAFTSLDLILKKDRTALYFLLGGFVPLVGVAALSTFHYVANRYAFLSLTSWLMLVGLAARELYSRLGSPGRILSLGVAAVLVVSFIGDDYLYYNYQSGNRPNWKAAAAFIQSQKLPGDVVFCSEPEVLDYYLGEPTLPLEFLGRLLARERYHRIWLVEDLNAVEIFPEQVEWMRANAIQVARYDVHVHARYFPMAVYLYENASQ